MATYAGTGLQHNQQAFLGKRRVVAEVLQQPSGGGTQITIPATGHQWPPANDVD